MTTILNRIAQICDNQDITITALEKKIGASKGVLSRALSNNTDIQSKWLQRIVENYPLYSPAWLLTGEGEMLKSSEPKEKVQVIHKSMFDKKDVDQNIPIYDINASAGLSTIFSQGKENIIDSLRLPNIGLCDGAIMVSGNSMYPLIKAGDLVVFKFVQNVEHLLFGNIYVIDYEIDGDSYLVIKYINKSEDHPFSVKLVSYNDKYFQPQDIPVSSIRTLAIVKASVTYNNMH